MVSSLIIRLVSGSARLDFLQLSCNEKRNQMCLCYLYFIFEKYFLQYLQPPNYMFHVLCMFWARRASFLFIFFLRLIKIILVKGIQGRVLLGFWHFKIKRYIEFFQSDISKTTYQLNIIFIYPKRHISQVFAGAKNVFLFCVCHRGCLVRTSHTFLINISCRQTGDLQGKKWSRMCSKLLSLVEFKIQYTSKHKHASNFKQ